MTESEDRKNVSVYSICLGLLNDLRAKWKIILFITTICAGLGAAAGAIKRTYYFGTASLMIQSSKGMSGLGGALQLAQQFGLMGGGMSGIGLDEDKLLEIIRSRNIVTKALLRKGTLNGKEDLMANHYIEVFQLREKIDKVEGMEGFKFTNNTPKNLSYIEDSLLTEFYEKITEKYMVTSKKSKSGIISVQLRTLNAHYTKLFVQYLIEAVVDFYVSNKIETDVSMADMIQARLDSIQDALTVAENKYAKWFDSNRHLTKTQGMIEEIRLKRDVEILNIMYAEVVKNNEMAKFQLQVNTPIVQLIDVPTLPLKDNETHWYVGMIIGILIGVFSGAVFVLLLNKFKEPLFVA